ncbi:MAG: TSUP family transporter [Phormidesmis sp.]
MVILLLIFGVGLAAGFVDAIAGGGGLIMLPGLIFSALPVSSAIATNKLCGTFGSLTSSLKFAQSKQIDWRACTVMALPIILGAYLGSRSIGLLPSAWAEPLVIILMVAITLFVVCNSGFGMAESRAKSAADTANSPGKRTLWSIIAGGLIGFHDGFFGPGTGVFLVFVLLSLWPLNFLRATGTTKVLNLLANFMALMTFAIAGNIDYAKGAWGALGVAIGSFIGATFATKKGAKLIKPIFILVTTALVMRLLIKYVT